jgi:glyoxylase-like metal-dependent hydrolase (beta-lactamase superfamily II)
MNMISSIESRHFQLNQLAEGVYAAIHAEDGWAICNAGIIDLGDRTLVFDAFITPMAAGDLCTAAESLTGRPVHLVINSHYHNDHIWGNQAFPSDVDIVSTTRTRELIATEGPLEIQGNRDDAHKRLEAMEAQLAETSDETLLSSLRLFITEFKGIIATLPILQLRLPNLTFTGNMTFSGSKRSARLIEYEGGHSGSDAILHLPDDDIVFMSDILFIRCHPYFPDGDPEIVRRILAEIKDLQPKILVPGHGPVGQISDLDVMVEYIDTLNVLARAAIKDGATEEEIDKIAIPGKYDQWIVPSFFQYNLKFIYHKQLGK